MHVFFAVSARQVVVQWRAAMARLFFAVGVSRDVAASLRSISRGLGRAPIADCLRLIDVEQAHFTLRFLGEQSAERQAAALRAGSAAARGAASFDLEFQGLGVFPDERRPHTLWIGAGKGASELAGLAAMLEDELAVEGFMREARPFVPHLTLARVKRRPERAKMATLLAAQPAQIVPLRVAGFALMESRPERRTVRYIALETFALELPCTPSKS
jgi:2'-5' RNA ligase